MLRRAKDASRLERRIELPEAAMEFGIAHHEVGVRQLGLSDVLHPDGDRSLDARVDAGANLGQQGGTEGGPFLGGQPLQRDLEHGSQDLAPMRAAGAAAEDVQACRRHLEGAHQLNRILEREGHTFEQRPQEMRAPMGERQAEPVPTSRPIARASGMA
jgi:hypothetical protein